jgi:acyl-CoA synthetase (AMP-forming)/AMP-acid ligase II
MVGEIWLRGRSVAAGYWKRPTQTRETFRATTSDGASGYLRTGDVGALVDGELYVTGRIKDMLVVNGRNLYPQDIEYVAAQAHSALAAGVVFGAGDRLVLIQEVKNAMLDGLTHEQLIAKLRAVVRDEFEVHLADVVLVPPGGIAKTTSNKVRRGAMREAYLGNALTRVQPLKPRLPVGTAL